MTTLIGLVHDGEVFLAGDSQTTIAGQRWRLKSPKVWIHEHIAFGFAGAPATAHQLRFRPPSVPAPGTDLVRWAVLTLIPHLRVLTEDVKAEFGETADDGFWDLLVGGQGRLLKVSARGDVFEEERGYVTTGTGGEVAIGALDALRDWLPASRIGRAMTIAAERDIRTSLPYTLVFVPRDTPKDITP